MKAYSLDLRERVLRAVDQGEPRAEMVRMLGVSAATIKRYLKQRRETGHVRPKAIPGRPARKAAALQVGLLAQLEAYPDASLERHCQIWQDEHGMRVSTSTMSRLIEQVGWTRKKSRWQPASAMRSNEPTGGNT